MASDSCTLEGGHDSLYEYQCSLCEEGQHVEATKFCKECFVYMCDSCVHTKHNKFPLNKRHQMLEQTQFSTVKASPLRSFPTKRCAKHPGELINIYCGEHDVVCCIVCKTLEHSNCANSKHLFDAAKGIHTKSKECQNIIQETETFISIVEKVISDGKSEMTRFSEAKVEVKNKIADFRKRVDMYFDDLEAKCLDELQNLESKIISDIEQNVKYLDVTRREAEDILQQLQSFEGDNECELFVHVKEGNRLLSDAKGSLRKVSRSVCRKESLHYEIDPKIEEFLKSLETFGSFTDKPVTIIRHSAKHGEPLDTRKDMVQPLQFVFDSWYTEGNMRVAPRPLPNKVKMCVLPSGTTLIHFNKYIRAFNATNQPIGTRNIPEDILSLCPVGNNEAAVLYREQNYECNQYIQNVGFVTGRTVLVMHRQFSTESNASEMVYSEGLLYVCCEMKVRQSNTKGQMCDRIAGYHIAIYNKAGQLQRYIPQLPLCFTTIPEYMTVSDNSRLFFAFQNSGVLIFSDIFGNEVSSFDKSRDFSLGNCSQRQAICADGTGQFFVLTNKNEVLRLSLQYQKSEVILSEVDGIKNPLGICFGKNKSMLLVLCSELSSTIEDKRQRYTYTAIVHSFNLAT
ncbi:uncharacterized protein LOC123533539 [Mercenaria mercenaria]|uniref:uncharacterized protein LOC123533539 n=1 Tax=Mercenaria mercenaria TaxID=6596 RepID=UPI00234F23DD|nr:uncharacterized protein LOC123533539 [Mercenaria mercenaria]